MHSPQHNRVDSIRDDSVYKSVGGDKSQSGASAGMSGNSSFCMTAASSNLSKLKMKLQQQVHGLTSEQVAIVQDKRAKVDGGDMAACI